MSGVIGFLAGMGQDSALRHAQGEELIAVLEGSTLDTAEQAAIVECRLDQLNVYANAGNIVCCGFAPGKQEDDESEEEPSKDDDEVQSRLVRQHAA